MRTRTIRAFSALFLPAFFACGGGSDSGGKTATDPSNATDNVSGTCNAPKGSACFDITFTGLWTKNSHPVDFPPDPHFSPLIGATHNGKLTLWAEGKPSSPGIQSMAETGNTSSLKTEIQAHIARGSAQALVEGKRIDATESTQVSIVTSESFPLLSVTSMIAPSPDWFVGVSSLPLRENGDWIDEKTIPLDRIYDAGTDDGDSFTSPDVPATPHKPIQRLIDRHFGLKSPPIASLIIKRVK